MITKNETVKQSDSRLHLPRLARSHIANEHNFEKVINILAHFEPNWVHDDGCLRLGNIIYCVILT